MAERDVNFSVNVTGAENAVKEVKKLEKATEDLARQAKRTSEVDGQLDPKVSRPSRDQEAANAATVRSLENVREKVRFTELAYYDLNQEMLRTGQSSQTFSAGATQVGKSTGNASQSLLLFSQGFEDAQYGMRGVLNNIPGLVIALGGTAGLAGAVSIAAVGFSLLFDAMGKTEEKASDVEERIKAVADNLAAIETDRFEAVGEGIDLAREAADSLKQSFEQTRKAEGDLALAALSNAEKVVIAQQNIAAALGQQVDRIKELAALEAAADEKRTLLAEQAIAAEKQKLVAAAEATSKAADKLSTTREQLDLEQTNLVALKGQLEALQAQRDELTKISEQRNSDDPGLLLAGLIDKRAIPRTPAANRALESLNSQEFQAQLAGTQAQVDRLEELVRNLSNTVPRAENALIAANTKQEDLARAVELNIQRTQETLQADTLVAKSEALVETGKQFATEIDNTLKQVEVSNELGKAAKTALQGATADGAVTANEVTQTSQNLQVLISQIQAGQAAFNGNISELLALQRTFVLEQNRANAEILNLKKQVFQLQSRSR